MNLGFHHLGVDFHRSSPSRVPALLSSKPQEHFSQSRIARIIPNMPKTLNTAHRHNLSMIDDRDPSGVGLSHVQIMSRQYRRYAPRRLSTNPIFDRNARLRI